MIKRVIVMQIPQTRHSSPPPSSPSMLLSVCDCVVITHNRPEIVFVHQMAYEKSTVEYLRKKGNLAGIGRIKVHYMHGSMNRADDHNQLNDVTRYICAICDQDECIYLYLEYTNN